MKTVTLTVAEYALIYGCSPQFISRQLRKERGMIGMVGFRKIKGKTTSWHIYVLRSWFESKKQESDELLEIITEIESGVFKINNKILGS